jgi:hypothetical protein
MSGSTMIKAVRRPHSTDYLRRISVRTVKEQWQKQHGARRINRLDALKEELQERLSPAVYAGLALEFCYDQHGSVCATFVAGGRCGSIVRHRNKNWYKPDWQVHMARRFLPFPKKYYLSNRTFEQTLLAVLAHHRAGRLPAQRRRD